MTKRQLHLKASCFLGTLFMLVNYVSCHSNQTDLITSNNQILLIDENENDSINRSKRQLIKDSEIGNLKTKLLTNLNNYSRNKNGDALAPIADLSSSKEIELPLLTTISPIFNLFQQFTTPPSLEPMPNLFGNLFSPTLPPPLVFPTLLPTFAQTPSLDLSNTQPTSVVNSFSRPMKFNSFPVVGVYKPNSFSLSPLLVPRSEIDSFDALYDDSDDNNAIVQANDSDLISNNVSGVNEFVKVAREQSIHPTYVNRTSINENTKKATSAQQEYQIPCNHTLPSSILREWRNRLHKTYKQVLPTAGTLVSNDILRKNEKLPEISQPFLRNYFSNTKLRNNSIKSLIENRRQLISAINKAHINSNTDDDDQILSFQDDKMASPLVKKRISKLFDVEKQFRNKTFIDNLYPSQSSIENESSSQHDYGDDIIQTVRIPSSTPITAQTLQSYLRNQREYSKRRHLNGAQISPVQSAISPFNFQYQPVVTLSPFSKQQQQPNFFSSLFPQPQSQLPIPLLSEFPSTTLSPFFYALTTTTTQRANLAQEYVKDLENLGDDYEATETHGNLLCPSSSPKGTDGCVKLPTSSILAYEGLENNIEENMDVCNSQRLNSIMKETIVPGNAEASKRAIQKRAESELGTFYNVICGTGFFSYIAHTDEFCLTTVGDLNCYVFSPVCSLRLGLASGIAKTKRFLQRRYSERKRDHPKSNITQIDTLNDKLKAKGSKEIPYYSSRKKEAFLNRN